MRKALTAAVAVLALGATSAMAAGMNSNMTEKATGTIKSIDGAKSELTLQDGKTFDVAKGVNLADMTPGEKVTVTYTQSGEIMGATMIKPAA